MDASNQEVVFTEETSSTSKRTITRKPAGGHYQYGHGDLSISHDHSDPPADHSVNIVIAKDSSDREEWLNSIMFSTISSDVVLNDSTVIINSSNNNNDNNAITRVTKIQKVPKVLRDNDSNNKSFDPLVVSIGPYHHGKPELQEVEDLKPIIAKQFVKESDLPVELFYRSVDEVAEEAMRCYKKSSIHTDIADNIEKFKRIMFLDGCFVLHFMWCILEEKQDQLKMRSHIVSYVQRDLLLLENQLPFVVLKALMGVWFKDHDRERNIPEEFIKRSPRVRPPPKSNIRFFRSRRYHHGKMLKKKEYSSRPAHLLELVQRELIGERSDSYRGNPNNVDKPCSLDRWNSYRSAKELKSAGIYFRRSDTHFLNDVKFDAPLMFEARLKLPPIIVDDNTRSMLLNLVAYETCPDAPGDLAVTSYICFMDNLIDTAEDVKELRSKEILLNKLGSDQMVAELFNEIGKGMVPNRYAYCDADQDIEKHYRNRGKVWLAEWLHTHFSTPWTVIGFMGATVALFLSLLQTYYEIVPPDDEDKCCNCKKCP